MKTNKNKTLKLSEQEYLAQLQMLYRNCPCPRILYTISELGYTMGEIAAGVSTLGCRATAFEIVDLLNGRLPIAENGQPTALFGAIARLLGRPVDDLLEESRNRKFTNQFDEKPQRVHPNDGRHFEASQTGMAHLFKAHLREGNTDGSLTEDVISAEHGIALRKVAGDHVIFRGAKGPTRSTIRRTLSEPMDKLDK
jgi:hypothetical protein